MSYQTTFRSVKRKHTYWVVALLLFPMHMLAQLPAQPDPPRLVVDLADILSASQEQALEQKLLAYNDSTSTQIVVLTVNNLAGLDPSDFAYRIGQNWGVGSKGFNNGVVILIKPKTERSRGQAFIATGYGMEEKVPDAKARRIIDSEMIPLFKAGDYYGGIDKAVDAIIALAAGTYLGQKGEEEMPLAAGLVLLAIIAFIALIIIIGNRSHHINGGRMRSPDLWTMIWLASMANKGHAGSWGKFTGGSGGFGGRGFGGGGFGGFGGGSFGGGGAGGSW
jgi:uncharacterized protein